MAKKRKKKKAEKRKQKKPKQPVLTSRLKRWIGSILLMLLGVIIAFSFFDRAGLAGGYIFRFFEALIGKTIYFIPFLFWIGGFLIIKPRKKRIVAPVLAGLFLLILGISGLLTVRSIELQQGGWAGYILSWPLLEYFGSVIAGIVSAVFVLIGLLIFWEMLPKKEKQEKPEKKEEKEKPKFEIKPVDIIPKKKEEKVIEKKEAPVKKKEEKPALQDSIFDSEYKMPPLSLLDIKEEKADSGDTDFNTAAIQRTLQHFGISVEMSEVHVGPTVTQYTLKPAEGVKLSKITTLNNDLALALASHPIRIEAPIPGRSLVGIEVPNKERAIVKSGALIASDQFKSSPALSFALGRDVMGSPMFADLSKMPHLLVAGATGSGKTISLNSLILSLIFRNSPKILRLILIDPKKVEFPVYGNLPHLLTPVILDARKAVNALNWLTGEMERRFEVLREFRARDIATYNRELKKKPREGFETMPYIVLVIDELADLMMSKGKEVESGIVRLSQLARAVGIHLVVATQRPSVEVITGLIKANITSRIAFQVASQVDSRTILDTAGSEKLLGRGDMLFVSSEYSKPKRIQGGFVSAKELKKVVGFIVKENAPTEKQEIEEASPETPTGDDIVNFSAKDDLYEEAKELVIQYQKASASLLQRRLQIGYARAARILDMLEEENIVGPQDGAKPRDVFIKKDDYQDPHKIKFQ